MTFAPAITRKPKDAPSRVLLYSAPKWGKSSFAAYCPKPIFLMSRGEDGLRTLLSFGRVPEVDHFEDDVHTFDQVREAVSHLLHEKHDYRTFVVDTINGVARLLAEEMCGVKFGEDWAEFAAYGRGVEVCEAPWLELQTQLERLRQERRMSIVLLAHQRTKTVKNPAGPDYDQFMPDLPDRLLTHVNRWADAILWGGFDAQQGKAHQGKAKVSGGAGRTLLTGESAAHVVGNRYGLPRVLNCGTKAADAWAAFANALKAQKPQPPQPPRPADAAPPTVTSAPAAAEPPATQPVEQADDPQHPDAEVPTIAGVIAWVRDQIDGCEDPARFNGLLDELKARLAAVEPLYGAVDLRRLAKRAASASPREDIAKFTPAQLGKARSGVVAFVEDLAATLPGMGGADDKGGQRLPD